MVPTIHDTTRSRLFFTLTSKRRLPHWSKCDETAHVEAATQISPVDGRWWTMCPSLGCDTLQPHDTFKAALEHALLKNTCAVCDAHKALVKAKADAELVANSTVRERFDALRSEFVREEQEILALRAEGRDFSHMLRPPSRSEAERFTHRQMKKKLAAWSKAVKRRDKHTCQKCGASENLRAHHKVPLAEDAWLALDLNNGVTLCDACHEATHEES